jgi:flagellar hook-length control protein FliK
MKINDTQTPATDPGLDSPADVDSSSDDDQQQPDEPSAFSRVLAKKQEARQETATQNPGKRGEGEMDPAQVNATSTQTPFGQVAQAKEVESTRAVEVPSQLQSLVREISVVSGKDQVHIELNSNVLRGLHIQIEKQDGAVAIQFQSASPEVTRLLSSNLDSLSQGLVDRGVSVSDIRITDPRESQDVPASKRRPNLSERRPPSGGQGGRR